MMSEILAKLGIGLLLAKIQSDNSKRVQMSRGQNRNEASEVKCWRGRLNLGDQRPP